MRHRQLLLAFSVLLIVAASLAARRSNDPKYQKTTVVRGGSKERKIGKGKLKRYQLPGTGKRLPKAEI